MIVQSNDVFFKWNVIIWIKLFINYFKDQMILGSASYIVIKSFHFKQWQIKLKLKLTVKNINANNIIAKSSSALNFFKNLSLSFNTFDKFFTEQKHEPGILMTYLIFYLLLMYFQRHDAKTKYLWKSSIKPYKKFCTWLFSMQFVWWSPIRSARCKYLCRNFCRQYEVNMDMHQ